MTSIDLGFTEFNCTHPMGVENCPIHKDDPGAPLHDCKYGKPMVIVEHEGKPAIKIEHGGK